MQVSQSINVRLNVIFVCLTTLLLVAFGIFGYVGSKSAMEQQLADQSRRVTERLNVGLPGPSSPWRSTCCSMRRWATPRLPRSWS